MKYFFHVLLILLAAFIISWLYEVYVVRDWEIAVNDVFQRTIDESWWWNKILMGEGSFNLSWFVKNFASSDKEPSDDDWSDSDTTDKDSKKGKEDLIEYGSWVLDQDQASVFLVWWIDERYRVLEFCTPTVDECRDSYKEWMREYFGSEISWSSYSQKPYLLNFDGIDERVWAWLDCVDSTQQQEYLDEVYAINRLNQEKLTLLTKKMWIEDFDTCVQEVSNRFQLTVWMREAKSTFGLKALPSYVIIDSDEERWITIPWLYEKSEIWDVLRKEFPLK